MSDLIFLFRGNDWIILALCASCLTHTKRQRLPVCVLTFGKERTVISQKLCWRNLKNVLNVIKSDFKFGLKTFERFTFPPRGYSPADFLPLGVQGNWDMLTLSSVSCLCDVSSSCVSLRLCQCIPTGTFTLRSKPILICFLFFCHSGSFWTVCVRTGWLWQVWKWRLWVCILNI